MNTPSGHSTSSQSVASSSSAPSTSISSYAITSSNGPSVSNGTPAPTAYMSANGMMPTTLYYATVSSTSTDYSMKRPAPNISSMYPKAGMKPAMSPMGMSGSLSGGNSLSSLSNSANKVPPLKKKKLSISGPSGVPGSVLSSAGTPLSSMSAMHAAAAAAAASSTSLGAGGGSSSSTGQSGGTATGPDGKPKKKKGKGGSSCHQCKSRRNFTALTYCTSNLDKKNKSCRKKFCEHCLKKFYKESPAAIPDKNNWRCPSCRKICCCAACRRRKQRDTGPSSGSANKSMLPKKPSSSLTNPSAKPMAMSHPHGPSPHGQYLDPHSGVMPHHPHMHPHHPHSHGHPMPHPHPHHPHPPHPSHPHMRFPPPTSGMPHSADSALSRVEDHDRDMYSPRPLAFGMAGPVDPMMGMPGHTGGLLSPELGGGHGLDSHMPALHLQSLHSSRSSTPESFDDDLPAADAPLDEAAQQAAVAAHEQQVSLMFAFSQTPRVKKHIKYLKARKDLTDLQKVEAIADLLRSGFDAPGS